MFPVKILFFVFALQIPLVGQPALANDDNITRDSKRGSSGSNEADCGLFYCNLNLAFDEASMYDPGRIDFLLLAARIAVENRLDPSMVHQLFLDLSTSFSPRFMVLQIAIALKMVEMASNSQQREAGFSIIYSILNPVLLGLVSDSARFLRLNTVDGSTHLEIFLFPVNNQVPSVDLATQVILFHRENGVWVPLPGQLNPPPSSSANVLWIGLDQDPNGVSRWRLIREDLTPLLPSPPAQSGQSNRTQSSATNIEALRFRVGTSS